MRALLALIFLSACSSSDPVESNTSCPIRYSVQKSEFFDENAYRIIPTLPIDEVLAICDADGTSGVGLICAWAKRKESLGAGDVDKAVDDAYWPKDQAELITRKLNKCS